MRIVLLALAACAAVACRSGDGVDLPREPKHRQLDLAQRVLTWGQSVKDGAPIDVQDDAALVLSEVVLLDQAPRLRLLAASGPTRVAAGAARALARIRLAREKDLVASMGDCAAHETLLSLRAACLVELRDGDRAAWVRALVSALATADGRDLVATHLGGSPQPRGPWRNELTAALETLAPEARSTPPVEVIRTALATPGIEFPAPHVDAVVDRLRAEDVAARRTGLREVLAAPGTFRPDARIDAELARLVHDEDAQVRHLDEAVFLRRSLADHPASLLPAKEE